MCLTVDELERRRVNDELAGTATYGESRGIKRRIVGSLHIPVVKGCVILLANSYEAAASVRDAAAAGRRFPRESHCLVLRQWREGHSGTCLRRTIVGAVASNRYRALSGRIARATDDRRGRVTAADHRADTCLPVDQVRAGLRRGQTAKRSPVRQTAAGQRATIIRLGCVMPYAS